MAMHFIMLIMTLIFFFFFNPYKLDTLASFDLLGWFIRKKKPHTNTQNRKKKIVKQVDKVVLRELRGIGYGFVMKDGT
jgi:hypothetical protein